MILVYKNRIMVTLQTDLVVRLDGGATPQQQNLASHYSLTPTSASMFVRH